MVSHVPRGYGRRVIVVFNKKVGSRCPLRNTLFSLFHGHFGLLFVEYHSGTSIHGLSYIREVLSTAITFEV